MRDSFAYHGVTALSKDIPALYASNIVSST